MNFRNLRSCASARLFIFHPPLVVGAGQVDSRVGVSPCRTAFSLSELLAVICILGLIASASMFILSSAVRRAERSTSMETLKSLIQWTNDRSRAESTSLQLDFEQQFISSAAPKSNQSRQQRLDGDLRLIEVLLRGAQFDQGKLQINFDQGGSDTFAIRLRSGSTSQFRDDWLVVCGPSGEILQYEHTSDFAKSLNLWLANWAHLN